MDVSQITLRDLRFASAYLGAIADAAGIDTAMAVVSAYGGTSIWIPKSASETFRLLEVIGPDKAQLVIDALGGRTMYVPLGSYIGKIVAIERALDAGLSLSDAARYAMVSVRTIARHRARRAGTASK